MQLTKQSDFGLRALIYLAVHPEARASAGEIADRFGVSHNHLLKVANRLAAAGIIDTYRGRNGGLALARSPAAIRIGEVVRVLEGEMPLIDCARPPCPIGPACRLKGIVDEALQAFLSVLDARTLADLTRDREQQLAALSGARRNTRG